MLKPHDVVVITGASRGLGRHLAHQLARMSMRLVLLARHEEDLAEVVSEVVDLGADAFAIPLDVTQYEACKSAIDTACEQFGRIDVLVNNAGLSWWKPFDTWSVAEIDTVVDVNLKGTLYCSYAVLPYMKAQKAGQILNVASDVGRRAVPNMGPYVAAKHGVVGFSGSLLREVRADGIRVMCALPGIIDTYFGGAVEGSRDPSWAMYPEDMATALVHMLQQPANMVTDELLIHPLGQDY